MCDISAGSAEDKLLRQVIRANSFESRVNNRTPDFVEKAQINLRGYPEGRVTQSVLQCEFLPNGQRVDGQATIEYRWSPLPDTEKAPDADETRRYQLNGATGTSHDVTTNLYVRCDLPGELSAPSKKLFLHTVASFTTNLGPVKDRGTQDQQMSFVYLMARRAAEALGCENKPLAKDPAVKPLTESTP